MRLSAVVCMSSNHVIGKDNALPWHLPADLQHFKALTLHAPIIMGRKTHESIGKVLKGRRNIIISRDYSYQAAECDVFHTPFEALSAVASAEEVFVIGGENIYTLFLPYINRVYLTIVHAVIKGDSVFPELGDAFAEVSRVDHVSDTKNPYDYSFIILDRFMPVALPASTLY